VRKVSRVRSFKPDGIFLTSCRELEKLLCDRGLHLAATMLFRKRKDHLVQDRLQPDDLVGAENIERDVLHDCLPFLQLTIHREPKSVRCPTQVKKWFPRQLLQIKAKAAIAAMI
jgi:hypothetical protein